MKQSKKKLKRTTNTIYEAITRLQKKQEVQQFNNNDTVI